MTKTTSPPQDAITTLIDEAWELTRARKRAASRRLLEALEQAVQAQDVDAVVTVRVAANQMRYSSPDVPQTVFAEVLERAEHEQAELESVGLRPTDPRRLDVRLESLLLLLRRSPDGSISGSDALAAFVVTGKNGDEAFDFSGPYAQWRHLLERGYERAYRIYGDLTRVALGAVQVQIERQVKSVAVELITAGAEVRGLAGDTVPLVAFCLLHREIPLGTDTTESPVSQDRMNDAVIAIADDIAAMPETTRGPFIDLYRLSVLLGVAQRYAEEVSLTALSSDF